MIQDQVIFSSEYINVTRRKEGFYIESFRSGMSVDQFNKLMNQHPEIKITSFMAVKNAILCAPSPAVKFGEAKERIAVEVSNDGLKAYITLSIPEYDLSASNRSALVMEVVKKLTDVGIMFGIKSNVLYNELVNNKQMLIAEGIYPENGTDSIIKMYELKRPMPKVMEDGNVNHYELNLINRVNAGEWLGERTEPTQGTNGKSVRGSVINAVPGKRYPLLFDRKTVKEHYENGVTTLYAGIDGAVHYEGGRIGISNHLEVPKNVDFKTGNIDFEGFVTVKGAVEDGFSVAATSDIEILGEYGLGSIKEIQSRNGSVYIRGGIAGKNKAVIRCKKNLFTKFISDATIECEGSVHIGFYCINSIIIAKEVIVDSTKGQIIGGKIVADIKVASSIMGSPGEKRTQIYVNGFDRQHLRSKLEKLIRDIEELKNDIAYVKQESTSFANTVDLNREQKNEYERVLDRYYELRHDLKNLEEERDSIVRYLKVHGEGEVCIGKKAFPGVVLEIRGCSVDIDVPIITKTYYNQDGEIKEI